MTGVAEILSVAVLIAAAAIYLTWKGYQRFANKDAACGGCGSSCGGVSEDGKPAKQVVQSIELLTVVTADDRGGR